MGAELTGNFGGAPEDTSIGDCRLVRPLAENLSHSVLGLLQHYRRQTDMPNALRNVRFRGAKRKTFARTEFFSV
jgi:hypothetical protein